MLCVLFLIASNLQLQSHVHSFVFVKVNLNNTVNNGCGSSNTKSASNMKNQLGPIDPSLINVEAFAKRFKPVENDYSLVSHI